MLAAAGVAVIFGAAFSCSAMKHDNACSKAHKTLAFMLSAQDSSVPASDLMKDGQSNFSGVRDAPWPPDKTGRYRAAIDVLASGKLADVPYLVDARLLILPSRANPHGVPATLHLLWLDTGSCAVSTRITVIDTSGHEVVSVTKPNLWGFSRLGAGDQESALREYVSAPSVYKVGVPDTVLFSDETLPDDCADWAEYRGGRAAHIDRMGRDVSMPQFIIPIIPRGGMRIRLSIIDDKGRESNKVEVPITFYARVTDRGRTIYEYRQPGWNSPTDYLPIESSTSSENGGDAEVLR